MPIKTYFYPSKEKWSILFQRPTKNIKKLKSIVKSILNTVKIQGDIALKDFTKQFDNIQLKKIQISQNEINIAQNKIPEKLKTAINEAIKNITFFHKNQIQPDLHIQDIPGVHCWRKNIPIDKVGLYIPGGSAPLFSTVMMLGIPAKLAGCQQIILCSPPNFIGSIHPSILYTAQKIGINKIYSVGGAQAIAAMAYGTETIPAVNKIFGPGNSYVTISKQLISENGIAIDFIAGPSEVIILADQTASANYIAADLLSQSEHDSKSQVFLITTDKNLIYSVKKYLKQEICSLPRKNIIIESLKNSKIILVSNLEEGMKIINEYAPEHLIINCLKSDYWAEKVKNAGSVFLGEYSPESAGDYASGTNHTLPTNGYAKVYSGISVDSFLKKITFQKLSKEGLNILSKTIETMALAEGLTAHQRAISIRLKSKKIN